MGKAFCFGDNVDTDRIVPGQYLSLSMPAELAKVCMAGYGLELAQQLRSGDIFVAGSNFGCGSSREHAPVSIKAAGIECVIAKSFARIFYRNAINIGLPVLESPEAADGIDPGDEIAVRISEGEIVNLTKGERYAFIPFSPSVLQIIRTGGMVQYVRKLSTIAKEKGRLV